MTRWFTVLFILLASFPASAHEVRPAYLEVTETAPQSFSVVWKQPVTDGRRLAIDPVFPAACARRGLETISRQSGTLIKRWVINCNLAHGVITISGLDRTLTDVFARISYLDGSTKSALLRPTSASLELSEQSSSNALVGEYLQIGIDHIIFGPDHLLFVLGLVLLVSGWQIIGVATAFTVAHSLTLTWTALGGASLPQAPVEILIAGSILLLAIEIMRKRAGTPSLASKRPWMIAFFIGLIHGFGFAGALADIGLPTGQELSSLFLFNLGVEVGQVLFIAAIIGILTLITRARPNLRPNVELGITYSIGIIGSFWVIERLAGFIA